LFDAAAVARRLLKNNRFINLHRAPIQGQKKRIFPGRSQIDPSRVDDRAVMMDVVEAL
jgi:hypothetical protein